MMTDINICLLLPEWGWMIFWLIMSFIAGMALRDLQGMRK